MPKAGADPLLESDLIPYSAADMIGEAPTLVLAPHPDDEVLGCGGAILAHRRAGHPVDVVIVTDGRLGVPDPAIGDQEARRLRADEAKCAARVLGYGEPELWGYPDRGLVCDEALVGRLNDTIGERGYKSVFAPSPFEVHPDHKALAFAMVSVAYRSRAPFELCFYEVGVPLYPNRLLDISGVIGTKRQAIACFVSQLAVQNYLRQCEGLNAFRSYTLPSHVTYAEAYCVLPSADFCRSGLAQTELPPFSRSDLAAVFASTGCAQAQTQTQTQSTQNKAPLDTPFRRRTLDGYINHLRSLLRKH